MLGLILLLLKNINRGVIAVKGFGRVFRHKIILCAHHSTVWAAKLARNADANNVASISHKKLKPHGL